MKVLVTGGAGFVGSHFVERLLKDGHKVTAYDNLSSGKMENIKHLLNDPNFRFIKADILDLEKLKTSMKDNDIVYHFAAMPLQHISLDPKENKDTDSLLFELKNNTIGMFNVLEAMRLEGIKKLIFSSSSSIYGDVGHLKPIREDYAPLLPVSMYAASKLANEGLVSTYSHIFGIQTWMFRFARVIGPGETQSIIIDFIKKLKSNPKELEILGDGKQSKSFFFIDDCIDAILFALRKANESINIFNLGSEDTISAKRIGEVVCEEMNLKNVKFKYTGGKYGWKGDVPLLRLDISKIKALGISPRYNSEESVRMAVRGVLNE